MTWRDVMISAGAVLLVLSGIVQQGQCHRVRQGGNTICQGQKLKLTPCQIINGNPSLIDIKSLTILTSDVGDPPCSNLDCKRVIHKSDEAGLSDASRHLYQWIAGKCQGKNACDATNETVPEWWKMTDNTRSCKNSTQYFAAVYVAFNCLANTVIETSTLPPTTPEKTRPTTPTTTTPFPVYLRIYQPELQSIERVILGVAIGMALAILLVLLIVLYCCERYRNHRKFGKLLRKLGAPQAESDPFDELDFGKKEAWHEETQNLDALGEYTGVKPDEFLTLDKHTMEQSGQIMYDTPSATMKKGNSCATLDRIDRRGNSPNASSQLLAGNNRTEPVDYNTEENLELERRMAATLNYELEENYVESPQI